MCPRGRHFFVKRGFILNITKKFATFDEQLKFMENKCFEVFNREECLKFLKRINYCDISALNKVEISPSKMEKNLGIVSKTSQFGSNFQNFLVIYGTGLFIGVAILLIFRGTKFKNLMCETK